MLRASSEMDQQTVVHLIRRPLVPMISAMALLRRKPTTAITAEELPSSADDFRIWPWDFCASLAGKHFRTHQPTQATAAFTASITKPA